MSGLLVTGMHHSGTSMTAAVLESAGWDPGAELVPDDPLTGKRYVEDAALVALHRRWFARALPVGVGHADWGISSGGALDLAALAGAGAEAAQFSRARSGAGRRWRPASPWLAKDPRAALVLPVWATVPGLRFVLVYRSPWDTVDSIIRLGHPPFVADPGMARDAWFTYSRALLDHARAHRSRCLLVSAERVALDPVGFARAVASWTGVPAAGDPAAGVDRALFVVRPDGSHLAQVSRLLHRREADLLEELDAEADLPRPTGRPRVSRVGPAGGSHSGVQVVLACHDDGRYIDEAVASVDEAADATDLAVELTIVDDGSTDPETLRLLALLDGSGRQVVRTPWRGLSAARNAGAARGRTPAVLPLDADNRLRPAIMQGVGLVATGAADVVHGPWQRFGLDRGRWEPPPVTWASLVPDNSVDACAVVSRPLLQRLGGWDEDLTLLEDWDLWLRALRAGARFHLLAETTFDYLVRPGSLTACAWDDPATVASVMQRFLERHGEAAEQAGASVEPWRGIVRQYGAVTAPPTST